jgi:mannose-6-phosphate isomerase-like protein (cupin superfamily)
MNYVFDTTGGKRYRFPTHLNDLVIDRAEACASEVLIVTVEPGHSTHLHCHDDFEQIFYIINGNGIITIGPDKQEYAVAPTQVVKIPPATLHTMRPAGGQAIRYLCIDALCPGKKRHETTWEEHVRGICREQGYRFEEVAGPENDRR